MIDTSKAPLERAAGEVSPLSLELPELQGAHSRGLVEAVLWSVARSPVVSVQPASEDEALLRSHA